MNRSRIREEAFKLIYSLEIQKKENIEEQLELYLEDNNLSDEDAVSYIKDSLQKSYLSIHYILLAWSGLCKRFWQESSGKACKAVAVVTVVPYKIVPEKTLQHKNGNTYDR